MAYLNNLILMENNYGEFQYQHKVEYILEKVVKINENYSLIIMTIKSKMPYY